MRKSETYNIAPSENITLEMACFLNIKKEVHKIRFDAKVGDYIELELRTVECRNNLDLFNHYQNLRIEFLQKYNQYYPNIPWVSIFHTTKNP